MGVILLQQQTAVGRTPGDPTAGPPPSLAGMIPPEVVAEALGVAVVRVRSTWPPVYVELLARGIADRPVQIAALATIYAEVSTRFEPVREYASGWAYDPSVDPRLARELGNTEVGDGPRYRGAGLGQLTGRKNFRAMGHRLGLDLEGNPDLANEPGVSAKVMAEFIATRGVSSADGSRWWSLPELARADDQVWFRRVWNGGTNGLAEHLWAARRLQAAA